MALLRPRSRLTLRGAAGWILVFALGCGVIWLVQGAPPAEQDLRYWRGPLTGVSLGGDGHASWITGEVEGEEHRFRSYHGIDWPGMDRLQAGSVVEVWYARDPLPERRFRPRKRYWIWRLRADDRELVPYDAVAARWGQDRYWIGWAGVGLLALSLAVWSVARARDPGPSSAAADVPRSRPGVSGRA